MLDRLIIQLLLLTLILQTGCVGGATRRDPARQAEIKAVGFLQREVPAWSKENGCYSCHNNGDAARALFAASRRGHHVPKSALADTLAWVTRPDRWDHNKGDPAFTDMRLANLQFAASLLAATEARQISSPAELRQAAHRVAKDQNADGSWNIEPYNAAGSPVTLGNALATYMAVGVLRAANTPDCREAILKGEQWLSRARPNSVVAAATLLRASPPANASAVERRRESLGLIRRAQNSDGGWGPYPDSPSEPFDTAVVLLALAESRPGADAEELIRQGRAFLFQEQREDGSWPATTRPPGGESYAQQISTTGWVTQALLSTRE